MLRRTPSSAIFLPLGLAEGIKVAQQAAHLVSEGFPGSMEIKFERVCKPFMLLHVNRCKPS